MGRQLCCPHGFAGQATGLIMRVVNVRPNALAVAALALRPTDNVLEIGCGPGHAIRMMTRELTTGAVHAVDPSPVMLAQARQRNRAAIGKGKARLYRARAEHLPFADASMDKVLAVNVAYFWRDPVAVLAEICRVLRRAGILSIYVTDGSTMHRWPFASAGTHRLYTYADLRQLLRRSGLREETITVTRIQITRRISGLIAMAGNSRAFPTRPTKSNNSRSSIIPNATGSGPHQSWR
jgi:ubiquinone/menaquinone biosynthesis C-methylase UbiE